jgi:hypothetical protein
MASSYSSSVERPQGQSSVLISFTSPPQKMSAAVRSGWLAANKSDIGAPSLTPMRTARSEPTASITDRTSSMRSSSVPIVVRSESPMPRLSKRIRRVKLASRCMNRR